MEPIKTENHTNPSNQNQDVNKTDSAENFQRFIYELFDKNGILNDLRAHLRGHIVNVLKNAQTGDPLLCQKHFTQRLEPTYQALNILVAEYLLCQEFNYSISVFVSEIPLANMVFGFAKSLRDLGTDGEATGLRFRENDVWTILNYLGIKCDAEHVNRIAEMYKTQKMSPLLLCILNCVQLADLEHVPLVSSPEGSISSKSSNTDSKSSAAQCKHYAFCKACRRRYSRIKNKYRDKKKHYIQKVQANVNVLNVESLMKNIGVLERSLIDEMFEQLRSVYETEMDMYKAEHEGKIKNSLASHIQHFQRMKDELEESFKAREAALEHSIEHKKRFLWGLAKALRVQHSQMTKAMHAVKRQTAELADQEQNLKAQRTEAEESLKKRAEEMRQQIADELNILERHFESIKTERDSITRERSHLDMINSESKLNNNEVKSLLSHYNILKDELAVLKTYIEKTSKPKVVLECGTITEDLGKGMNNETARVMEGKPNRVVNDLKKQKNVNFSPQCKSGSETSASSGGSTSSEDVNFARQAQMSQLSQALPTETRHRDPITPRIEHSMREIETGWRKGAGEERSLFASTPILVPGDTLPFVGVIERRTSGRRHLLNRWRTIRRRVSPLAATQLAQSCPPQTPDERVEIPVERPSLDVIQGEEEIKEQEAWRDYRENLLPEAPVASGSPEKREKSPRSVLKEAKEKLKTVTKPSTRREKSPSAMLREAKTRLRKLEIEAEAVARSYRDFRRRAELRHPRLPDEESSIPHPVNKLETHHTKLPEPSKSKARATNSMSFDIERYLKRYQIDLDTGDKFTKKNTHVLHKPVSKVYSDLIRNVELIPKYDYLDKPISEFRKLYHPNSERLRTSSPIHFQESIIKSEKDFKDNSETNKNSKEMEFELLNQNIATMYNLENEIEKETEDISKDKEADIINNVLTVEVENVSEVKEFKAEADTDLIVVVESSVNFNEILSDPVEKEVSVEAVSIENTMISPKTVAEPKPSDRLDPIDTKVVYDHDSEQLMKITTLTSPKSIDEPKASDRLDPINTKVVYDHDSEQLMKITTLTSPKSIDEPKASDRLDPIDTKVVSDHDSEQLVKITTLTSPKEIDVPVQNEKYTPRVQSPSKTKRLNNVIGDGNVRNSDMEVEIHNDDYETLDKLKDTDSEPPDDYADDFSNDVDNYKSENSPISLPKTSDDEDFWE